MNQRVTQLPKVVSVWQEDIDLPEPLGQFAARFSHMPGTIMLLSGADLDASQYHILGILPWLSIKAFGSKISATSREKIWTLDTDPFACLQTLLDHCHLKDAQKFSPMAAGLMGYFAYDIKDLIEDLPLKTLPAGWRQQPPPPSVQSIGDAWATEARSAVLRVPSVIIPHEHNYLLNPLHPDFKKVKIGKRETFSFDPRLKK